VEVPQEWRTSNYTGKDHLSWPSYLATFFLPFTGSDDGTDRVCETCRDDIALKFDRNVQKMLRWMRCCMVAGGVDGGLVDIVDLRVFMRISKTWRVVSNLLMSELRPLQYKLPTELYTKKEKHLLWGNRAILSHHTQWIVPLMKCVDWHNPTDSKEAHRMLERLVKSTKQTGNVSGSVSGETVLGETSGETVLGETSGETVLGETSGKAAVVAPPVVRSRPGEKLLQSSMRDHGGEGCTFVGCRTTMCSRTCQGWRVRTSSQWMTPEDALKLLSCPPTVVVGRARQAWLDK